MNIERMQQLSGIQSEKQKQLSALREVKQQLVLQFDDALTKTQYDVQLDEGFFDGLRATLGTIMTASGKAAAKISQSAATLKDNVKELYLDEKAKVELKNMTKALQGLSVSIENLGKEGPTILKKDTELAELLKVFVDCAKKTAYEVARRAAAGKETTDKSNDKPDLRGKMAESLSEEVTRILNETR